MRGEYEYFTLPDSSHTNEVQDRHPAKFASKLARVFGECKRVLKDDGILAFSFHHSRAEGWMSIFEAITGAGFEVVAAHPIYGEMKGASPKSSTKEPITLDAILVCKKSAGVHARAENLAEAIRLKTEATCRELQASGFSLSQSDTYVVAMSNALAAGSREGLTLSEMHELLSKFTLPR